MGSTAYEREMSTPPTLLLEYGTPLPITEIKLRLTTCLENLEMSGNLTAVREFDSCQGNVRDFTKNRKYQRKNLVREKLPKTVYS